MLVRERMTVPVWPYEIPCSPCFVRGCISDYLHLYQYFYLLSLNLSSLLSPITVCDTASGSKFQNFMPDIVRSILFYLVEFDLESLSYDCNSLM